MSLRRIAAKAVVVCLALGFFSLQPGAAQAEVAAADAQKKEAIQRMFAENTNAAKGGEQRAAVTLEQAIKIAKEAFTVPEGFDQFSTGFDQSEKRTFWELRWNRSGEPGDINVRVNAETGEIWSMRRWIPPAPGQEYRGLPKYTREQVLSTASALAEKMQPERFKETRLEPGRDYHYFMPLLHQERGQVEYNYNFARIIDGVPCLENGINVTVSGDTGEVLGFELRWDDTQDFPPTAGRITQAQAEQIFRAEAGPALFYFRPNSPGGKEVPLKLVYRLPGPQDQVLIDALTGKLLSKEGELYKFFDMAGGGGGESYMSHSKREAVRLTPVEEGAVKEAKNLLSREKALEMARSAVKVTGGYNLTSSRLEQDYLFKEKKTWHFNWQAGDESNRKSLDVSVDASTGELVSFNTDRFRSKYDYLKVPEVKFSEEAARKTAEEFIKKVQPGKWEQVVFKTSRPELVPVTSPEEKPRPRSYTFNWTRVAKGVQFPENGFYLGVDSTTGEVTNYQLNWWDVSFSDPKGVITQEAAAAKYLQQAPLTVAYMRLWSHDEWRGPREAKVHLVYYLAQRNFAMLDAFTGQPLDFEGNVISASGEKAGFDDLEGHPAREAVELLARSGIITGEDRKFRPDDAVTQAELIAMLVKSDDRRPEMEFRAGTGKKEPWYRPYYDVAARMGIIQAGEQPDPDAAVTREILARFTIHAMGYYNVARLSDIYVLNFQDAGEIAGYLRGHAALSVGLGLIEPVEGKFNPKAVVTRAEAATTLVKLLNSGK